MLSLMHLSPSTCLESFEIHAEPLACNFFGWVEKKISKGLGGALLNKPYDSMPPQIQAVVDIKEGHTKY